jgi:hypothetical protein
MMTDASGHNKLAESCIDRVQTVYCPHRKLAAEVTESKWRLSDGRWTSWVIVDCSLLSAGLIDCNMSCLSQVEDHGAKSS